MCTYNVRIDDAVLERVRPHFNGANAMQLWIEQQLRKALVEYANKFEASQIKRKDDSVIERLKGFENNPDGFFRLGGFMANSKSSVEELLDEASEKLHQLGGELQSSENKDDTKLPQAAGEVQNEILPQA